MQVSVSRRVTFNAAHRLYNTAWDEEKNWQVFGLCSNANYHGHNYVLLVKVTGEIDPETGYVIDLKKLKEIVTRHITDRFDHRNLNLDVAEFKTLNPTAENIAVVIWKSLRKQLDHKFELTVTLYETERNFVEYSGR